MRNPLILIAALGLINALLAGCANTKEAVLPQDGPSMKAIYERHIHEMDEQDPLVIRKALGDRSITDGDDTLQGYSREAADEIDTIFPRLPNPTLIMYVYPHLAGDEQVPVPGYVTMFPMYEQVEYALPGEVPTMAPRK